MRDRGVIYTGLLIFLGLITFPVWHDLAAGTTLARPRAGSACSRKAVRGASRVYADIAHALAHGLAGCRRAAQ